MPIDVKKTMTAINEFQNALEKNRLFMTMMLRAQDVWNEFAQLNPDELQTMVDQKNAIAAEIDALASKRAELQSAVDGLQTSHDAKRNTLESELAAIKSQFNSDHAANVQRARDELTALALETENLKTQQKDALNELANRKSQMEGQLASLKKSFEQAQQALHG